MAHDDFLKQFREDPPPDFAQSLLDKLHALDDDAPDNDVSDALLSPAESPRPRAQHTLAAILTLVMLGVGAVIVGLLPNLYRVAAPTPPPELRPIRLHNLTYLKELYQFGDGKISALAWSPDSQRLAAGGAHLLTIYDTSLKPLLNLHTTQPPHVSALTFSPDGRILATGTYDGALQLRDSSSGRIIASLNNLHTTAIDRVRYSLDGGRILTLSQTGELGISLYDNGRLIELTRITDTVLDAMLTEDGVLVVSERNNGMAQLLLLDYTGETVQSSELFSATQAVITSGGTTVLVPATSGLQQYVVNQLLERADISRFDQGAVSLPTEAGRADFMHVSADENRLLIGNHYRGLNVIDRRSGDIIPIIQARNAKFQPALLSPSGEHVAVVTNTNRLAIWGFEAAPSGDIFAREQTAIQPVLGGIKQFAAGTDQIGAVVLEDGDVLLIDLVTGRELRRIALNTWATFRHQVLFNPSGTVLAIMGVNLPDREARLKFVDVQAAINGNDDFLLGDEDVITIEQDYINGMVFTPDGTQFITGGGMPRIWDMRGTPRIEAEVPELRGVTSFAFSKDGMRLAAISPNNDLRIINRYTLRTMHSVRIAGRAPQLPGFLHYASDHYLIGALSGYPATIWNGTTAEEIAVVGAGDARLYDADISSNGAIMVTAQDRGLHIWNIKSRSGYREPESVLQYRPLQVAFSANDQRIGLVEQDGVLYVLGVLAGDVINRTD